MLGKLDEHRSVIYEKAKAAGLTYPELVRSVANKKHADKRAAVKK